MIDPEIKQSAMDMFALYSSFVQAGFNENQALQILLEMISSSLSK